MTAALLAIPDELPWAAGKSEVPATKYRPVQLEEGALRGQMTERTVIQRFIEAGNATLTVVSKKSGTRFTFKFARPDAEVGKSRPIWVSLLNGPDNTADFNFLGTIWPDATTTYRYRHGGKSKVSMGAASVQALQWFTAALHIGAGKLAQCEVWHEGRCGRCGRKLTVPASIESGFGPECAGKM